MKQPLLMQIDHLVYSTTDLEKSVIELEARLGVRPLWGGQHPGRGTRNALLALSDHSYLEVIGPDSSQVLAHKPRWFEIDSLNSPRLVTWAVKETELNKLRAKAKASGVELGAVSCGTRHKADGSRLHWRFTEPGTVIADGIVPFFIDWEDSPHPAASVPPGPALESLRAEHPNPTLVMDALSAVGLNLPVEFGPRPALIATLRSEGRLVELR